MKKNIILIFIILSPFFSAAQHLTFSPAIEIEASEDMSKKIISLLWVNYINSLQNSLPDSVQKSFWHNESENMMKVYQSGGELFTFNIRKYSDTVYEIHSLNQYSSPEGTVIMYIYKVCATETEGTFKLLNYFDLYKHNLQNYNSESVDFYYPCGFHFDKEKADDSEKFIKQFRSDYNLKKTEEKIICILGNSFAESSFFVGFDFIIGSDENKYAGMYHFPRTILTQRQDHTHEFIHALINPEYPDILDILSEGIATYYGGTSGFDYAHHRNHLKDYINKNSVDFSDPSLFYNINIGDKWTKMYYIVGALVIEYALKNHGIPKVIELLSCKDYQEIYSILGINPEDMIRFLLN